MIKIDFEFTTEYGVYRDAITLPEDHTLSEEDINVIKQERVDAWISLINTPVEPTLNNEQDIIEIDGVKYIKAEV